MEKHARYVEGGTVAEMMVSIDANEVEVRWCAT